jgi:cytochrome P450 PksS
MIEEMRERVYTLSNELLDKVQHKGEMELIRDFALPLPMTIIAEMLGVPAKDSGKFHRWSKQIVSITSATTFNMLRTIPTMLAFMNYIRQQIKERHLHPREDLISALVQAEEADDHLSEDELLAMVFVLLIAGHETTVNLIASGTQALLENPDQMEMLRSDPTLMKTAVEELVRYVNPVEWATERYAREDVTLYGETIPRGALVYVVLASANRDARQFLNPDRLDITREHNRHVGFGQGAHYCVGAPLARLEAQSALNTLLRRMPNLRLKVAPDKLHWRKGLVLRGLEALPLEF